MNPARVLIHQHATPETLRRRIMRGAVLKLASRLAVLERRLNIESRRTSTDAAEVRFRAMRRT